MKTALAASAATSLIAAPALAQDRDRVNPRLQDIPADEFGRNAR